MTSSFDSATVRDLLAELDHKRAGLECKLQADVLSQLIAAACQLVKDIHISVSAIRRPEEMQCDRAANLMRRFARDALDQVQQIPDASKELLTNQIKSIEHRSQLVERLAKDVASFEELEQEVTTATSHL